MVEADMAGEIFTANGLTVVERNWLDVFHWVRWTSSAVLPPFERGQTFVPSVLMMEEGTTTAPKLISEVSNGDIVYT